MGGYFIPSLFSSKKKRLMPDITMCDNTQCELKEKCFRFMAKPNEYRQSYYEDDVRNEDGSCDKFYPMNQLDLFK